MLNTGMQKMIKKETSITLSIGNKSKLKNMIINGKIIGSFLTYFGSL